MAKERLDCATCGGALTQEGDEDHFRCTHCGSAYIVDRSTGAAVLRAAKTQAQD